MAVSISIAITQNSQNIANNTSNVTVKVNAKWTGGSFNRNDPSGWLKIDGVKYTFASDFNANQTTSGSQTLFTKKVNVNHNSDGTKTLACSASFTTGVGSGTVTASESKTLTTIPRKSTLTVANGTLGTKQTLTITEKASTFKHKLTYWGGSGFEGYILGSANSFSTALSVDWTPPKTLASANVFGDKVSIKFTLSTYTNEGGLVGENEYTKEFTIPNTTEFKPSCSISVSDATSYFNKYGMFVQGKSKLKIDVTGVESYSSMISSYKTTVDGKTFTKESFTTDVISSNKSMTITSTVTDMRERTGTATKDVDVSAYSPPKISSQKATRCDSNGVRSSSGDYLAVTFNAEITSLNSKNLASYSVEYKKTTESAFTKTTLSNYAGQHSISGGVFIFAADKASSYDITITATDDFTSTNAKCVGSSIKKLWSWLTKGLGFAFGKIAELENTVEFDMDAKFNQPVYGKVAGLDRLPYIPNGANLNDYKTTGCWAIYSNASDVQPSRADKIYCGEKLLGADNTVPPARAGRFEVISATGEGIRPEQWSYLRQRFIPYNSSNAVWERDIARGADNVWTFYEWFRSSLNLELSDKIYNKSAITVGLSANSTMAVKQNYTKIPFNENVLSFGNRLTFSSNSVLIGSNISHVKASAQIQIKSGLVAGIRHFRIQKLSKGTTTSWAWSSLNSDASVNASYSMTPIIIPVTEGDLLFCVYYTGDTDDYIVAGSTANGKQSYLTVEEL